MINRCLIPRIKIIVEDINMTINLSSSFQPWYNGFNPAFYHVSNSEISEKQRTYNFEPHIVYLAYFSDNFIKVGITHQDRQFDRWLEQGARFAVVIFRCDNAYEARDYENKTSTLLKLPEVIRTDVKLGLLYQKIDSNDVQKRLYQIIDNIEKSINTSCLREEVTDLNHIHNPENIEINKDIIDISKLKPLVISGKAIALFGSILVLENSPLQYMVSLKKVIGHKINLSSKIQTINFEPKQVKLF